MSRRLFSAVLALAICAALLTTAWAAGNASEVRLSLSDAYIEGTAAVLRDGGELRQNGRVTASFRNGVLTLNGYDGGIIYTYSVGDLTIELAAGSVNSASSENTPAIYVSNGSLVIKGTGALAAETLDESSSAIAAGAVSVYGGSVTARSPYCGVRAEKGDVAASGGSLDAKAYGVSSGGKKYGCGIYALGSLRAAAGEIRAEGSEFGVYAVGGVTVTGGAVYAEGDYDGIASEGDVTISGGTVRAHGYGEKGVGVWAYGSGILRISGGTGDLIGGYLPFGSDIAEDGGNGVYLAGQAFSLGTLDGRANAFLVDGYICATLERAGSMSNLSASASYSRGTFSDVDESAWYGADRQNVIAPAIEYGLMSGRGGSVFDPDGNISLAEVIAIACRLHNRYFAGDGGILQLTGDWTRSYIQYALVNGIIASGRFTDFGRAATRAEVAYIFRNALAGEFTSLDVSAVSIPDVSGSGTYDKEIITLYAAGVLGGVDAQGRFLPNSAITRAQTAALAARCAIPGERL